MTMIGAIAGDAIATASTFLNNLTWSWKCINFPLSHWTAVRKPLKSYVDFYVKVKICKGTDVDAMICFHLFPASVLLWIKSRLFKHLCWKSLECLDIKMKCSYKW
jgi:hypothetical protein